jgi:hypothetical protein
MTAFSTPDNRIRTESCGCRYDSGSGLRTHDCSEHSKPHLKVTFYRGRPTRGATLKTVLTVLCDAATNADPFKRDEHGPLWHRLGLHQIQRRLLYRRRET